MTRQEIKREISDIKKEMRIDGVKVTSFLNGGIDSLTRKYNERLFFLNTKLAKTP